MVAMATMRGVVLCLCVAVSWGGAAAQLGRSSRNLSRDLLEELTDTMSHDIVRFSEVQTNQSLYLARLDFDMRAMGPLYNVSPLVIDTIAKKQAYPEGMVTVSDGHFNVKPLNQEWRTLVVYYLGPTFIILISALVIVVLPLAGLFWICWHCCRMGRRKRPFDRKYDGWMRGILSILLIVLLTAFLFGVVCAFATDSQVESGASESSDTIRMGLRDVYTFFNETIGWTRTLLIDNFSELEANLAKQQKTFGLTASWKMGAFSRAASVTILYQMVQDLDAVREKLITVQALTATLRLKAEELNTGLRKVKNQLLQTLAKCDQPKCRALQEKYKIGQLDTEIQYSQMLDKYFPTMPDVSELLHNVTELLDSGIKEEMAEGQRAFSELQRNIQRNVDLRAPSMSEMLSKLGGMLKKMALQVQEIINEADMKLRSHEKYIDDYEKMYREYGPYRRYAALAASCSLLLIMCLLTLGLMCGVCGKRPDVYGASDCCNKGTGSSCLLCGIGFIFLLGSLVTLVMLAHFVFGLVATRFVCDPLIEPRDNRLIADVERMVDLEYAMYKVRRDPDFNLTSVIVSCHSNQTVYRTLHLWRMIRMQTLRTKLEEEVARRSAELEASAPAAAQTITILRPGARDKLRQLADTGLSDFDFDRILSALETNMTSLALDPLAAQLNSTARSLQQPLFQAEAASLRRASATLDQLQRQVLRPMTDVADRLNVTARELRDDLRFNHSSLKEAITFLMHETSEGEAFLNDMSRRFDSGLFSYLGKEVMKQFEKYLSNLESTFLDRGARCGPLSNAYNVSRDAFCAKVLLPVHGYWMSLSWCVLLLLPLLLLAPRLARLYGRPEPYPGPRQDNEYLYDAYADRDNVPLANAYAAEKRAREARPGRSRSSRSGGEPSLSSAGTRDSAVAPSLDSYHARRYNDMAPKHWEEGPPRYVGSTEYERPPPYYYPGPHDRQ